MNNTKSQETVKHTPGPWFVEKTQDGYRVEIVAGDDRSVMAEVFGDDNDSNCWPMSVNARLISAAPDLLEACRAALTRQDWPVGTMKIKAQIQAALEKAGAL